MTRRCGHIPVMRDQVLAALAPRDDATYVDGTFGGGGYSEALLARARCRVFGIDRDPAAVRCGRRLAQRHGGRLTVIEGRFGEMERLLARFSPGPIAGVALDLGVSSQQLDTPERGFSFRHDGPLDMRMGGDGETAADLIARLSEQALAELIRGFGEERFARRIARAIAAARARQPIRRTGELAAIVRSAVPRPEPGLDPATRTFQALRIFVNDELAELASGLQAAERVLAAGGRLVVVSFHSLEDRIVKSFLAERSGRGGSSRHLPEAIRDLATFHVLTKRPVVPDAAEIAANPRARSAKLRAGERTAAPAVAGTPALPRLPSLADVLGR